jgi:hypothetical protein
MAVLPKAAFFVRIFASKIEIMPEPEINNQTPKEEKKQITFRKTLMFSLEFGFMIVLPLVILAFAGNWLAERYHNRAYLFGGLILALLISTAWMYKKINDLYNDFIK